jgi:hypothetical protein
MMETDIGQKCEHRYHLGVWTPILIIGIGMLFSLGNQGIIEQYIVDGIWPLLLGLIGIVKLVQYKCKCEPGCACGCK